MDVIANLASMKVVTTDFSAAQGVNTRMNGHFTLPIPYSVGLTVDSASYILPQNAGSLPKKAVAEFLVRFPMYDHALYNFFLEDSDITGLDLTAAAPQPTAATVTPPGPPWVAHVPGSVPRCQTGRGIGGLPLGASPNSTAMLPLNNSASDSTFGCIITDTVDITALNPTSPGTDEVMLWWDLAAFSTSEDVLSGFGATAGLNTPAGRNMNRQDPELSVAGVGVYVYASNDDGVSWYRVNYLEPIDLTVAGTLMRFAFINTTGLKIHLMGFAALFPNLIP
jgi:hypothetical protein